MRCATSETEELGKKVFSLLIGQNFVDESDVKATSVIFYFILYKYSFTFTCIDQTTKS